MVTIFRFDHMIAENQQLNVESCVSQFYVSCLVMSLKHSNHFLIQLEVKATNRDSIAHHGDHAFNAYARSDWFTRSPVPFVIGSFGFDFNIQTNPSRKRRFTKTLFKPEEFEVKHRLCAFAWSENILKTATLR